ncbi:MAG: hemerythrin domain-containing protein [Thermoprotei archaeon]|jgi:hemerythrin-like domain-containing protein
MGDFLKVLRDDHAKTMQKMPQFEAAVAGLSLGNFFGAQLLVNYVSNELVERHFKLEEEILFPLVEPVLKSYLPKEEPIRMLKLEHIAIARTADEVRAHMMRAEAKRASESGSLLLSLIKQHIFREENGLFGIAEKYLGEKEKAEIESKLSIRSRELQLRPPSLSQRSDILHLLLRVE